MVKAHTILLTAPGGWLYHLLVLAHVTCAVGGFGSLAYRGYVLALARERSDAAAAGALAVYAQVSRVGEVLVYGMVVFGIAAVGASGSRDYFHRAWVIAALAVFVAMMGALHGMVRPAERRYRDALVELAQMPGTPPPGRPPQLAELDRLRHRVGLGTGLFNILLLGALYLMVFKP
jgi:hypothetical protein